MKKIIAVLLVVVTLFSFAGCGEVEQPDWLKQQLCDHVYDEEDIIKEPTCGRNGSKMKICSACGNTKSVAIKATGEHVFDAGVVTDDGVIYTCLVCGKKNQLKCNHTNVNNSSGYCEDCEKDIFNGATYKEVERGELLAPGWYRISPYGGDLDGVLLYWEKLSVVETRSSFKPSEGIGLNADRGFYPNNFDDEELKKLPGFNTTINGGIFNKETTPIIHYADCWYVYIENQYKTSYAVLEYNLEYQGYLVRDTVEYTFRDIVFERIEGGIIEKVMPGDIAPHDCQNHTEWIEKGIEGVDLRGVLCCQICGSKKDDLILANIDDEGQEIVSEIVLNIDDLNQASTATFSLVDSMSERILRQSNVANIGGLYNSKGEIVVSVEDIAANAGSSIPASIFGNSLGIHTLYLEIFVEDGTGFKIPLKFNVVQRHEHKDGNQDLVCDSCDKELYTEVEAKVGDKVVGNWYRVYANQEKFEGTEFYKEAIFRTSAFPLNIGYAQSPNQDVITTTSDMVSTLTTEWGSVLTLREGENERGRYTDIYIQPGKITYMDFLEEKTAMITQETSISAVRGAVYRLEIN